MMAVYSENWHEIDKQTRVVFFFAFMLYTQLHALPTVLNRLQLTCYVMHQQFNIQQLYALPTLYLCVLYLSQNKQRLVPLTA